MKRYLSTVVAADLSRKMVFLTGPRQVGKTTMARQLMAQVSGAQYFNYDVAADRKILQAQAWNPGASLLAFDELHKMRQWKAWLKGVYTDGRTPNKFW
jgi:uncharacterized protein